ncbi:unnamed protein product [Penicillium nalgiovense]|uniref:Alpha-galactosidase n=1 Tax=Penicillium nalgiovense TaxID=60175 RepID=A0A9W4IRZ6_PENNA|nr:unnamed protein product [Penicillium nalgiovense]CAG7935290.1 unnamed protein product [Penicillium nalgiovense]CAG7936108.1 unnamed protein product [Penicillium nalgiovense]CAG7937852.1 unnamed protein product [Penicillium nalgiovense]CAG7938083.1 unnamed protein product [Penicillium nalgiovense]
MLSTLALLASLSLGVDSAALQPRLDDGVAETPPMGWSSYNHYSCSPNETTIRSNAKALVDLGLDELGYRYVGIDCGWTVADRLPNGSLTWNETMFPSGFPAVGQYIHDLGLLSGVYEDAGIKTCSTGADQAGSLYHEQQDAATFMSWNIDALKYDNCYSQEDTGYPNTDYAPSTSPRLRYANMADSLAAQSKKVLFQICEWGIDFPALWAPSLGHTWRIGNDIIPAWRAIFRTLNQAAPQTSFAGPGQWPDLDMMEVGNNVLTTPEEQTHFSMWAILKSPLVIGGALKDEWKSISDASLSVLSNKDVIGFNQDSLGHSASLRRRWSDQGYEVWSGPLSGGRTVAAVVNWAGEARELTLNLPDIGLQSAGIVKDIWNKKTLSNVKTTYTASVGAHGVMLLELQDTTTAGVYASEDFATVSGNKTTFHSLYANTTSTNHTVTVEFAGLAATKTAILLQSFSKAVQVPVAPSARSVSTTIPLTAGYSNEITISSTVSIKSIRIASPSGTYYACTSFTLGGSSKLEECDAGFCTPVGSKIGYINAENTVHATIPASVTETGSETSTTSKYLEIDYINNDIALATSWDWGSSSRNLTISLNGGDPVRLEVPLSGRHSELFGPGKGWWDSSKLGILIDGWKNGPNDLVIGNEVAGDVSQTYGADFVGLHLYD